MAYAETAASRRPTRDAETAVRGRHRYRPRSRQPRGVARPAAGGRRRGRDRGGRGGDRRAGRDRGVHDASGAPPHRHDTRRATTAATPTTIAPTPPRARPTTPAAARRLPRGSPTPPASPSRCPPATSARGTPPPRTYYWSPDHTFRFGERRPGPRPARPVRGDARPGHRGRGPKWPYPATGTASSPRPRSTGSPPRSGSSPTTASATATGARRTFDLCWTQDGRMYDMWLSGPVGQVEESRRDFDTARRYLPAAPDAGRRPFSYPGQPDPDLRRSDCATSCWLSCADHQKMATDGYPQRCPAVVTSPA